MKGLRAAAAAGALIAALAAACSSKPARDREAAPSASGDPSTSPSRAPPPRESGSITFVEDGLDDAFSRAREAGKKVVVDVWAPWCEACLSLRAEIARHPELGRHRAAYVFASLDIDRPAAASFTARYGAHTLPTILVLDASSREVLALRGGSISIAELDALLDATARATDGSPGQAQLALANAASARGDPSAAAALYRSAMPLLAGASRTEAVLGALGAFADAGDYDTCVDLARGATTTETRGAAPWSIALSLQRCGEHVQDEGLRRKALGDARRVVESLVTAPPVASTPFDQAEALSLWAEILRGGGDGPRAARAESQRLDLLERAATDAGAPEAAQAFDHARAKAYLALDRPGDALSLLRERARELPTQYETHGRLGTTLLELGHADEAALELERAIDLAYGPPRLVYMDRLASAYRASGRAADAKKTLEREVAGWNALEPAQRDARRMGDAAARLEAMRP